MDKSKAKLINAGFSIIEVTVSIAIGAIVIAAIVGAMASSGRLVKKSMSTVDVATIKKSIYSAVSCEKTFSGLPVGNPCGGNPRYIDLRNSEDKLLVSSNGAKAGKFVVRAYCNAVGLDVRVVKLHTAHLGNEQAIDWVGKAKPANPDFYVRDESRGSGKAPLSYDWNHPKSILSTPGNGGLCAGSFQNDAQESGCTGDSDYVKSIDYKTGHVKCGEVPTCGANAFLVYSGGEFSCDEKTYVEAIKEAKAYIDQKIAGSTQEIQKNSDDTLDVINAVSARIDKLGSWSNGTITSQGGSTDRECARLKLGTCPDGYLMYGYEARLAGSGRCVTRCVKIAPP